MFTIEFHQIPLQAFAELPAELRSEAFFRANELVNAYVDRAALELLGQIDGPGGVRPDRASVWRWLESKARRARPSRFDREALRAHILAENEDLAPALDLIDAAVAGYPAFLRGERDGGSILFDPARPSLWERYFDNRNPVYGAANTLAAAAAEAALAGRAPAAGLRVLEVGAGLGSATEALIARLGPRIGRHLVTDISPGFLRKAKARLESLRPEPSAVEIRLLDLNREPAAWRLERASFDLIHAVNVLHAVADLDRTARGLRELLAPGGALVLGECVRPARGHPVHPELVFLLLDELRAVRLDPERRPEPGFLDAASWRASLAAAGFDDVRLVPEFDRAVAAYPEHSLAAIVARAS